MGFLNFYCAGTQSHFWVLPVPKWQGVPLTSHTAAVGIRLSLASRPSAIPGLGFRSAVPFPVASGLPPSCLTMAQDLEDFSFGKQMGVLAQLFHVQNAAHCHRRMNRGSTRKYRFGLVVGTHLDQATTTPTRYSFHGVRTQQFSVHRDAQHRNVLPPSGQ
jgi:hypothetical protein